MIGYGVTAFCGACAGGGTAWLVHRHQKNLSSKGFGVRIALTAFFLAGTFTLLSLRYGITLEGAGYALIACLLAAVALIDFDTFTIPNGLLVGIGVAWLGMLVLAGVKLLLSANSVSQETFFAIASMQKIAVLAGSSLLGALVVGGGVLLTSIVYEQLSEKMSLGGGDIKLLFVVSLFFGLEGSAINALGACLCGLVFAFCWRKFESRRGQNVPVGKASSVPTFPFGPSIAFSTIVMILGGFTLVPLT